MQLYCTECACIDLHHHRRHHHHHCRQRPNHHLPVGPQSDVDAPHRVGGVSCWPPLFRLCLFSFICWLQAVSQIIHPHQHTRVPSPAPPKILTIHTHRFTHPHTLTLSHTHPKHNHLCVHSLTHLLAHSLIPFTLPITHSLTNSSHSHSHVQAVVRRTTASLRHMLLVGTSSPGELGKKHACRQSIQQVAV